MGFFDRFKSGQGPTRPNIAPAEPNPDPTLPDIAPTEPNTALPTKLSVVGEYYYRKAIRATKEVTNRPVLVLLPEPSNPHDRKAIGVYSNNNKVGHLSKDDARRYRKVVDDAIERDGYAAVASMIRGNDDPQITLYPPTVEE